MSNLKNGDLIMVKYQGQEVKGKFLKENGDGTKYNVFAKGKLLWVPIEDFIGPAEPTTLSEVVMPKKEKKATDEVVNDDGGATAAGDNKLERPTNPKKDSRESKKTQKTQKSAAKTGQDEQSDAQTSESEGKTDESGEGQEISLTKHQSVLIDHLNSKGIDVYDELNEVALATGLLNPQIEKAAEGLVKAGLVSREENETGVKFSITQKSLNMKTKKSGKNRAALKKMKPAAKGDAVVSKRDQVIALLKDKALTVNDIAEKLDTDPNYVREIKTSINKKLEEPEAGTVKGKIWKMLKDGKSPKEIATKIDKSSVYVYKIQKQMISSGNL